MHHIQIAFVEFLVQRLEVNIWLSIHRKNKPRRVESKNKETVRSGREATEYEKLIDFPRRPRPHSVHEEVVGNACGNLGDPVRERERAKREKEDRLVLLQRELNHVEESENIIRSSLVKRQTDGLDFKQSANDGMGKPSRQKVEDGASQKSGAYKSLLQRGQERILQREKGQQNTKQQMDLKPAIRQGNVAARSKRNLADEFKESEKDNYVKDENAVRDMTKRQPGELKVSHVKVSRSKPVQERERPSNKKAEMTNFQSNVVFDPLTEETAGSDSKGTLEYIKEPNKNTLPLSADSRIDVEEETGPKQQRHLPEAPLFFYGHSSLPRKFIMNNGRTQNSAPNTMQRGYGIQEKNGVGKRGKPPVHGGERKISGHVYSERTDVNKMTHPVMYLGETKQSGYSIEEQTEAFMRAQHGHELRTSKRASAQQRNQMQNNAVPSDRTVTISHAANI